MYTLVEMVDDINLAETGCKVAMCTFKDMVSYYLE